MFPVSRLGVIGVGLVLCAGAHGARAVPQDAPADHPRPAEANLKAVPPADTDYRIGVEDLLAISVWRDPDLTRDVPVRPDGKISLPLLQDIQAAGKTPQELGQELQRRLHEFLSNPSVTVIVREVNSQKVYMVGEVVKPGPIILRSKTRLLQAIALAGGVTPFGGRNGVLIYRTSQEGKSQIEVSYRDIVSGKRPDDNVLLEAGDTVVVR